MYRKECMCHLEMIQCEYHNVGCEVRMAHKDQEKHENEKYHSLIITKKVMTDLLHSQQGIQVVHMSLSKLTLICMITVMVKENSLARDASILPAKLLE